VAARPTVSDVAALARVSPSTVSRALASDDGRVAAGTRERILDVARELGYTPNRAARELITGRSNNIGFVIPDIQNPYFASILKGVQFEAQREDYSIFVADSDEDPKAEFGLVNKVVNQVDGLILCSSRMSDADIASFAEQTTVVLVNRRWGDLAAITLDEEQIVRLAIEHLYALGHRHIAYAGGPDSSWTNKQRRIGIDAVTPTLEGLRVSVLGPFSPVFNGGAPAADLAVASGATALIACNDLVAMGAVARLRTRGFRVPEDVSVVGIDDSDSASLVSPALTSVHAPLFQVGRSAVSTVLDVVRGIDPPGTIDTLDIALRVRESTTTAPVARA
jgi:DNA-binding LacI/PurR family transcriptional regulator